MNNDPAPDIRHPATVNGKDYDYLFWGPDKTGLALMGVADERTGIWLATPLANPAKRSAAHLAWAGARHSRAPGTTERIMAEMGEKGVNPDAKLDEMFRTYGHTSVGDMAHTNVHFNNVPMHVPMFIFNYGTVVDGQEKSTRFQGQFGKAALHPLNNYIPDVPPELEAQYQALAECSLALFAKVRDAVTPAYERHFRPNSKDEKKALDARVLDTARASLMLGMGTGFSMGTSARDWSRLIGQLRAAPQPFYRGIGDQIEALLAPSAEVESALGALAEAPSLVRHTEPDMTIRNNLERLREHATLADLPVHKDQVSQQVYEPCMTSLEAMAAQYLAQVSLRTDFARVVDRIKGMCSEEKAQLSAIIYSAHDKFRELPSQLTITSDLSVVLDCDLGVVRDFNRHRAIGRFIQLPNPLLGTGATFEEAASLLHTGFILPRYLDLEQFRPERDMFVDGLKEYYRKALGFIEASRRTVDAAQRTTGSGDYSFVLNILPLAQRTTMVLHFDPKQLNYMTKLRVKPGGHINYRELACIINDVLTDNPLAIGASLALVEGFERPDAGDRKQFFDRS